ncbi:MAG: hypothetical protein LBP19_03400 [Treponema sp.]|nr:hypothetical protein [Treponema sp.]
MNQDHVKEQLLAIEDAPLEFSLVFSGKKSKKVNGLYNPETREIVIHNRNFTDDNLLLYTAIHEYAHHLHACTRGGKLSARAHTSEFWAILHNLLEKAEAKHIYRNVFASSPELTALTETIRTKYLAENGTLVKEFGEKLIVAHDLCEKIGGRFEDYIDRVLRIPRLAAMTAIKTHQYNITPFVGPDNMRFLAGIRDEDTRAAAESALLGGKSPDSVKIAAKMQCAPSLEEPSRDRLEKEKARLERTIGLLKKRLDDIEQELEQC